MTTSIKEFIQLGTEIRKQNLPVFAEMINDNDLAFFTEKNDPYQLFMINNEHLKGRVLAYYREDKGSLGWFEANTESEEVVELLKMAINWLKEKGCTEIVGPVNGSTWNNYRFNLTEEFPVSLGEPFQPLFYPELWRKAGFVEGVNYFSTTIPKEMFPQKLTWEEGEHFVRSMGFSLHHFPENISDETHEKFRLFYNISFQTNPYFEPIELEEFIVLSNKSNQILNRAYSFYVLDEKEEIVSVALSYSDFYFKNFSHTNLYPIPTLVFKTIATNPEYQNKKIGSFMMGLIHGLFAADENLPQIYYMLMHENNITNVKGIEKLNAKAIRKYTLMKYQF